MGVIHCSLLEDEIAGDSKGPFALNPPSPICSAGTDSLIHGNPQAVKRAPGRMKRQISRCGSSQHPLPKGSARFKPKRRGKIHASTLTRIFSFKHTWACPWFFFWSLHSISVPFLPLMNNGTRDDPGLFHGYVWWDAAFSTNAQLTRGSLTVPVLLQLQLDIWR